MCVSAYVSKCVCVCRTDAYGVSCECECLRMCVCAFISMYICARIISVCKTNHGMPKKSALQNLAYWELKLSLSLSSFQIAPGTKFVDVEFSCRLKSFCYRCFVFFVLLARVSRAFVGARPSNVRAICSAWLANLFIVSDARTSSLPSWYLDVHMYNICAYRFVAKIK